MGIKSVDFANSDSCALKVKDHTDVVAVEPWRGYGFNYIVG